MCTCPNYMIWKGEWTKNDRPKFSFVGHHIYKRMLDTCKEEIPFIQVPCGKCLECRIQYARTWSDRCVLESQKSNHNYFVTLTYDDFHLPKDSSLDPEAIPRFMNLLRKHFKRHLHFDGKIRFFACGEYGTGGERIMNPHYHILLFNCPLTDLSYDFYEEVNGKRIKYHRPPSKYNTLMWSETIFNLWRDDKGVSLGHIGVDRFSYDTAAYVAQYVTKKCNPNNDKIYEDLGIYPEFLRMSRNPGIGGHSFDSDMHFKGKLCIPSDGEAHLINVPRYFDKLFVKKYGEDIFNTEIAGPRAKKKLLNYKTYLASNHDLDKENKIRDYNLTKLHHLKNQL